MMYCASPVDAQHRLKIEERIKLSRVPHDTLPGSRTEKRDQHVFQVLPLRNASTSGLLEVIPADLIC